MKWFPRRQIVLMVSAEPRDEPALEAVVGATATTDPLWNVVLQLIEQAERESNLNAQEGVADHAVAAGYLGAAEAMRLLRQRLLDLQLAGREP